MQQLSDTATEDSSSENGAYPPTPCTSLSLLLYRVYCKLCSLNLALLRRMTLTINSTTVDQLTAVRSPEYTAPERTPLNSSAILL